MTPTSAAAALRTPVGLAGSFPSLPGAPVVPAGPVGPAGPAGPVIARSAIPFMALSGAPLIPTTTLIPVSLRPGFTAADSTTFTNDINMTGSVYGVSGYMPKSTYASYQTPFNVLDKVSSVVKAEITKELYKMLNIFESYSSGSMNEAGTRSEYEYSKKRIKTMLVEIKQNDKLRPQEKVSLLYQVVAEIDNIIDKLSNKSTFDISKTTDRSAIMNRTLYLKLSNPPSIKKQILFLKIVKTWSLEELSQLQ
jgi:hypothetical protein